MRVYRHCVEHVILLDINNIIIILTNINDTYIIYVHIDLVCIYYVLVNTHKMPNCNTAVYSKYSCLLGTTKESIVMIK